MSGVFIEVTVNLNSLLSETDKESTINTNYDETHLFIRVAVISLLVLASNILLFAASASGGVYNQEASNRTAKYVNFDATDNSTSW